MLVNLGLDNKLPFQNRRKTVYWFVEFAPQMLLDILESDNRFILADEVLELRMPNKFKTRFKNLTESRKKAQSELDNLVSMSSIDDVSGGCTSYEFQLHFNGIRYGMQKTN